MHLDVPISTENDEDRGGCVLDDHFDEAGGWCWPEAQERTYRISHGEAAGMKKEWHGRPSTIATARIRSICSREVAGRRARRSTGQTPSEALGRPRGSAEVRQLGGARIGSDDADHEEDLTREGSFGRQGAASQSGLSQEWAPECENHARLHGYWKRCGAVSRVACLRFVAFASWPSFLIEAPKLSLSV